MPIARVLAALTLACVAGCGGNDEQPGDITDQVYGTWACTAAARPNFTFTVTKIDPNSTKQSWAETGGAAKTCYVHLTELYLDDANDTPWRDFTYNFDTSQTKLTSIDQLPNEDGQGVPSYHCLKQ